MSSQKKITVWYIAAFVLGAAVAFAVSQARVHGIVKDEQGRPLAGVKLTVTQPGNASYRNETVTDAKGSYAVTLLDATRTHTYRFEKDGFQSLEQSFKVPLESNERKDFELISLEAAKLGVGQAGRAVTAQDKAVLSFNEGAEAAQKGDLPAARARFTEALALDPALAAAWTALATIAFTEKDYAAAVTDAGNRGAQADDIRACGSWRGYAQLGETASRAVPARLLESTREPGGDLFNQGPGVQRRQRRAAPALFTQALASDATREGAPLAMTSPRRSAAAKAVEKFLAMAPTIRTRPPRQRCSATSSNGRLCIPHGGSLMVSPVPAGGESR